MNKTWKKWTDEDDQVLKNNLHLPHEVLAVMLSRTKRAISSRISKMGLGKPAWTEEEDELLRELAGRYSQREVADTIGRNLDSVRYRAHKLGISLALKNEVLGEGSVHRSLFLSADDYRKLMSLAEEFTLGNYSRMVRLMIRNVEPEMVERWVGAG